MILHIPAIFVNCILTYYIVYVILTGDRRFDSHPANDNAGISPMHSLHVIPACLFRAASWSSA